jgi:hypothetical protein
MPFTLYNENDIIKEDEMGGAYSAHEHGNAYTVLCGNPEVKISLWDLDVTGEVILKRIVDNRSTAMNISVISETLVSANKSTRRCNP